MIGPLEIVIIILIALVVFGGYRKLPALGRAAGNAARKGGEGARNLASEAGRRGKEIDTDRIARSAGEGMREVRELRAAVSGESESSKSADASTSDSGEDSTDPPARPTR